MSELIAAIAAALMAGVLLAIPGAVLPGVARTLARWWAHLVSVSWREPQRSRHRQERHSMVEEALLDDEVGRSASERAVLVLAQLVVGIPGDLVWAGRGVLLRMSSGTPRVSISEIRLEYPDLWATADSNSCSPCNTPSLTGTQVQQGFNADEVGDSVCNNGAYTGRSCGVIQSTNVDAFEYPTGVHLYNQRRATYVRAPGDSGGPVVASIGLDAAGSHVHYVTISGVNRPIYSHVFEMSLGGWYVWNGG